VTITAQLQTLRDKVAPWAKARKGAVEIGARVSELYALFAVGAPDGLAIRILFDGEVARDPQAGGFVDRQFLVVMKIPKGLIAPGDDTRNTAGHSAPYDLLEELRDLLRDVDFDGDTTEGTPDFVSSGIFQTPEAGAVDAYQLTIKIGVQLPAPGTGEE